MKALVHAVSRQVQKALRAARTPRAGWYWRRLRMMSAAEIPRMRLYRAARDRIWPRLPTAAADGLRLKPFPPESIAAFRQALPKQVEAILRDARQTLDGAITIFGKTHHFTDAVDWHRDVITGRRWPLVRAMTLNYRECAAGDPKLVWELNRQAFLPHLGLAYALTGEARYADAVVGHITSWIDQNPPLTGINWTSGIELAIRQLAWLWALRFIRPWPGLTPSILSRVAGSMTAQTAYIARHLSLYSSANNHLMAELSALTVIGDALGRPRWCRRAARLLDRYVGSQIHPDGVGAEQSPAYLAHTMEFVLLAGRVLDERDAPLAAHTRERLQAGAAYLESILDERDAPPSIGDGDSGRVLVLGTDSPYRAAIEMTQRWLGHARPAGTAKAHWFPPAARQPPPPAAPRTHYESGGCSILTADWPGGPVKAIVDAGPMGMPPMAGHGHADPLSLVVLTNGRQLLVDPGTYTYFGDAGWRDYFRGMAAHNTLRVDARDPCVFAGRFMALTQPRVTVQRRGADAIAASHDGYTRLTDPVRHAREVRLTASALVIADRVECRGEHLFELRFHCHPDVSVTVDADGATLALGAARFRLDLDGDLEVRLYCGSDNPRAGWYSPVYGTRVPTATIVARTHSAGRSFRSCLRPAD